MPKVIFSFDTEDYINPAADDFTKRICEVFDANGVTASFMVVGERARVLVERGRLDVIDALRRHEIGYHSYFHSLHPNVSEYLDGCEWSDGVAEFLGREHEGFALVQQVFERDRLWASVPAGYSWAPQMVYGYGRLGIPTQADCPITAAQNRPHHYINQLQVKYNFWLDDKLLAESWDPIGAEFESHVLMGTQYVITADHPTILMHSEFPDSVNFRHGANPPRSQWKPSPQRPAAQQQRALEHLDRTLKFVLDHPALEPSTFQALAQRYEAPPGGRVGPGPLRALAEHACGAAGSVELNGDSFSAADQFGLLSHAAAHGSNGTLPDHTPLRRLLGPDRDVVDDGESFESTAAQVRETARQVERDLRTHLPHTIAIGDRRVGPATFLKALAHILRSEAGGEPSRQVPIEPAPVLPAEAQMEGLKDLTWKGRWEIFHADFEGSNLKRHALLQSWTIRPAVGRS